MAKATCIIVDGPHCEFDKYGDEMPVWYVCAADDDGEPVGTVYNCFQFRKAIALGDRMARDRRLELVNEAMPA